MSKFTDWMKKQKCKPECTYQIPNTYFGEGVHLGFLFIDMEDINHFLTGGDMEKAWMTLYVV
jgi:hypothetical protein